METIKGKVEEIVFKNDENGFVIAVIESDNEYIYIKGYMPYLQEGEMASFNGVFKSHSVYGEQFEVSHWEVILPTEEGDIRHYLASGLIKGIGPAMAERIVDAFGEDTFDVIQMAPRRLLEIQGIGEKKLEEIIEAFSEQVGARDVIIFLQKFGLTTNQAVKVFKKLGASAKQVISENPYELASHIDGFGFKMADTIAKRNGIDPRSGYRIACGLLYALAQQANKGHVYVPVGILVKESVDVLAVEAELIQKELYEMTLLGAVVIESFDGEDVVYLPYLHYAESKVAKYVMAKLEESPIVIKFDITEAIDEIEEIRGIQLAPMQRQALEASVHEPMAIITGGPGTGKTTIINGLIHIFEKAGLKLVLAAPTGRAAKRMTEATQREAKTIHRVLEYNYSEEEAVLTFNKNEHQPLEVDVVIVDEVSMIDMVLMMHLTNAIMPKTRFILVGDADQLPSVGPGHGLRDLILRDGPVVTRLDQIFRQDERSAIAYNAHKINHGEMPLLNEKDKDFFLIQGRSQAEIVQAIRNLCMKRLPDYYGVDPIKDIQVLSPVKNSNIGTHRLNQVLQESLNPLSSGGKEKLMGERIFRTGDKVMQIKNNYTAKWKTLVGAEGDGVFNGDIGYISEIDERQRQIHVLYDDEKVVRYEFSQLDELVHAYAVTVHKSQGSEFPVIIMPMTWCVPMLMTRNILYTAITRAKRLVVLVGEEKYLKSFIENMDGGHRYSALEKRIRMLGGAE
jgi:exodeoxyribonuclease V alpha subunit